MLKTLFLTLTFFLLGATVDATSQSGTTMVYISTGNSAYAYHAKLECRTIKRCVAEGHWKKITLAEAQKMGRKPCGVCYKKKKTTQ